MQLKILPVSGSSLYIWGYCPKHRLNDFIHPGFTSLWTVFERHRLSRSYLHLVLLARLHDFDGQVADHDEASSSGENHKAEFFRHSTHPGDMNVMQGNQDTQRETNKAVEKLLSLKSNQTKALDY